MSSIDLAKKLSGMGSVERGRLVRDLAEAIAARDRQIAELKRIIDRVRVNPRLATDFNWCATALAAMAEQLPEVE